MGTTTESTLITVDVRRAHRGEAFSDGDLGALPIRRPLAGQVALVTGASRGIGAAIATELAHYGAHLVIGYVRSAEPAAQLARSLVTENEDVEAVAIQADVADETQARSLVAKAVECFGHVDILINNAGITQDRTLRKMTGEQWRTVIDTDLNSLFYCTQPAIETMIQHGGGRIVNISSITAESGNIGQTNYASAKAGMIGFTRALALELARYNITVNCVAPGFTQTDMVAPIPPDVRDQIVARIPLKRFGTPEEVAAAVRFLCVDGTYITGAVLNVNGGLCM
jgi:NAD(P)-dependent dehydrogenase (short-subunit alcohol dehydrogenase family)